MGMSKYRSGTEAIAIARAQSAHGPRFPGPGDGAGQCKQRVRELFDVPSDGSKTAAIAWTRTKHRIPFSQDMPIGTLLWWTGGSTGAGHVAPWDGVGGVMSTDVERDGYFDQSTKGAIEKWAPRLRFAGCSLDIDGVQVVPTPTAVPKPPVKPSKPSNWAHVRAALLAALNSPEAKAIPLTRPVVRSFIAATKARLNKLPKQ